MNKLRRSIESLYYFWEQYHNMRSVAVSITALCMSCISAVALSVLSILIFGGPYLLDWCLFSILFTHIAGFLYFYPRKQYLAIVDRMWEEDISNRRFTVINMLKTLGCFVLLILYGILLNPDKF